MRLRFERGVRRDMRCARLILTLVRWTVTQQVETWMQMALRGEMESV